MTDLTITLPTLRRYAATPESRATPHRLTGWDPAVFGELLVAAIRRVFAPWRIALRRSWIYRQFNSGKLADRVRIHPFDASQRRLEEADALLKGRFRFAGATVDVQDGSVFDLAAPSAAWLAALHGFDWFPILSSAGGEGARILASRLISEWIERNRRYSEPVWSSEIMARRIIQLIAHSRFVLSNSDILWRSRLFVSLRDQAAQLSRIAKEAPPGFPRIETAVALVLSQVCLEETPRRLEAAIAQLVDSLQTQILPDGGHVSRSPDDLLHAYQILVMVIDALTETGIAVPVELRSVRDRMAPMLRFFRHGGGTLAQFNGGGEGDPRLVTALLARDEIRGQPFLHAPHSGFQRLAAGKAVVILDCGSPPPGPLSCAAHAGCLSFEFGAGAQRIVVNCGAEKEDSLRWNGALRATAAHSTVTLADTSMMSVLAPGYARDLLGARLAGEPGNVNTSRHKLADGENVQARHDFYLDLFGIRHIRELTLSPKGTKLAGCDRLLPRKRRRGRKPVPFAVRFHIHPDVRISASQRGDILLKLPHGEGWRFRHGGSVTIEESVFVGRDGTRRAEQIVLSGTVRDEPVESAWLFEHIGTE